MKGKTVNLTEFLADGNDGKVSNILTPRKTNDWSEKDDSRNYEGICNN